MAITVRIRSVLAGIGWVAFFSLPLWVLALWDPFDASVTRLSHFEKTRHALPEPMVRHFPLELPDEKAWYYFSPGPLQANPAMQLLIKPSAAEMDRIYDHMSKVAVDHYVARDVSRLGDDTDLPVRGGEPMWVFSANGLERPHLNRDDHYFVTYTENRGEPAEAGICINKKLGTVVYYCNLGMHNTFSEGGTTEDGDAE